jgi:hypothetical protein
MSIEQADTVDIISTDKTKLNRYLAFVESGEILKSYPMHKDQPIVSAVVFRFVPDEGGRRFLAEIRPIIESAGFSLRKEMKISGSFN